MQLAFDFGDGRPFVRRDAAEPGGQRRIFFAILPDGVAAMRIDVRAQTLCRDNRITAQPLGPARYHVSLWGLEAPAWAEATAIAIMRQMAEPISAPSFAVQFDEAVSFSPKARSHPLVLISRDTLPALNDLRSALDQAMNAAGFTGPASYNPHVTMLYSQRQVAPITIPPVSWRAHDFVLLRLSQDKSRYDCFGRWPLR